MDVDFFRELAYPFVEFFSTIVVSGVATTLATQMLKSSMIPVPVEDYPRISAGVVSILATFGSIYVSDASLMVNSFIDWTAFVVGTFLVSVITYNNVLRGRKKSGIQL